MTRYQTYLIKTEPLHFVTPRELLQEIVEVLARIPKPTDVFSEDDDDFWTQALSFGDQLQLVQATSSGLIVAGDDDVFLLNGQRQGLEGWVLRLEDRGVETVVVLTASVSAEAVKTSGYEHATHKMYYQPIVFP